MKTPFITRESSAHYDGRYSDIAIVFERTGRQRGQRRGGWCSERKWIAGMVSIYNNRNQNLKNISGEQVGSYFGAALAIADLDDDGFDYLIVGAPLFTQQLVIRGVGQVSEEREWPVQEGAGSATTHGPKQTGGYEAGKVYVFWQRADNQFYQEDFSAISGKKDWARFGHAVAAVGDLNGDRFNYFIVDSQDGPIVFV